MKPTTEVVKITPAIATKWLEGNTHNRRISQRTVQEYAQQMTEGLWKLNGATIAFDVTGRLADGQHRLWACIEADTPFVSLVVHGVGDDVFPTIDSGHKRSSADALHVSGVASKHESLVASTVNMVIRYERGTIYQRQKIPSQVTLDYAKDHPEIIDWVTMMTAKRSWVRVYTPSVAAVAFLASRRYHNKAIEFVAAFVSGENLVAGSPILAFRNRLATEKRMRLEERTALCVLAWNAFIQARALSRMQSPRDAKFPVIKGA